MMPRCATDRRVCEGYPAGVGCGPQCRLCGGRGVLWERLESEWKLTDLRALRANVWPRPTVNEGVCVRLSVECSW